MRVLLAGILIAMAVHSTSSFAATVTALSKAKSLIKIDDGTPGGFKKGSKVCFFDDSSNRVGCGSITKAAQDFSYVKVSTKIFPKIKKGMTANVSGGKSSTTDEVTVSSGVDNRYNVKLGYVATVLSPVTFNRVLYIAPTAETKSLPSLWKKDQTASASIVGAFAEGEFGIGKSMGMSFGLRYRMYSDFEAQTDYSINLDEYVQLTQEASSIGIYSDFNFLNVGFTRSIFFRMGSGLDIDMSKVSFKAVQKSDDGASQQIASYTSSMNLISLRLNTSLNFLIGHLGILAPGVNLLIPAAAVGSKTSASVTDPQAAKFLEGGEAAANKDLEKAVDHKKASFGAEVYLATFIAF